MRLREREKNHFAWYERETEKERKCIFWDIRGGGSCEFQSLQDSCHFSTASDNKWVYEWMKHSWLLN